MEPSLDAMVAAKPAMSQTELDMLYFVEDKRPMPPPRKKARPAPAKAARPEWSELVASLRVDVERMKAEGTKPAKRAQSAVRPAAASTPAAPPAPPATSAKPATSATSATPATKAAPAPKRKAPKPIQDQWGLFDPEQCGFAALLAKLDEIAEAPEEEDASTHVSA